MFICIVLLTKLIIKLLLNSCSTKTKLRPYFYNIKRELKHKTADKTYYICILIYTYVYK